MRRSAGLLAALAVAGCEWFSTMADGVAIQPHEIEPRLPPPHAVPLDGLPEFDLVTADQVVTRPAAPDSASMALGEAYFRDFCLVCHGMDGGGAGPISKVFPAIPAINTPKVAGYTDSYVFALISKGRGLMPDYGRIPVAARWALVDYVRALPAGPAAAATTTTAPGATEAAPDTTAGSP